jgi:superfamily II DNA or RNA helicase
MLIKRWGLELKDIGVYNSSVDPKWKDFEFKKKIVISTLKSFGRGVDSPNMDVHVDTEAYISLSQFQQAVGRTGRKGGSKGFYLTFFDMTYTFIQISYRKKKEEFKNLFKSHQVVELDEKFEPVDRPEAVKIRKEFQLKWWKYLKQENEERMTAKKKYGKGE